MAVMPGEKKPEDEADLIRTGYHNLESADWWQSHELDGVVLYAWGRPRFRKVAAAIREAGIFLVLSQDSGGQASPLAGFRGWMRAQWIYGGQGRGAGAWLRFLKLASRGLTVGLLITDPLRAWHLRCGNIIACVSPGAADCYRKLCRIYGGIEWAGRVKVIPHPVEATFQSAGAKQLRQVVCVGRWKDDIQKRTWLLMEVIESLVAKAENVSVVIAGDASDKLRDWHRSLATAARERVKLAGKSERDELVEMLAKSQVFYSPSSYESFGIAAAEALCSGCSVVAGREVTMPSFEWFVGESSGTLADRNTPDSHLAALLEELAEWDDGRRMPRSISDTWCERLHANKVAERVVEILRSSGDGHGRISV